MQAMKYLEVVFNIPLSMTFFYLNCKSDECGKNRRVSALFHNRKMTGFVINDTDTLPDSIPGHVIIQPIEKFIDTEPIFTEQQLNLAYKLSEFYLCSLGETISCMLPSAKSETESSTHGFLSLDMSSKPLQLSEEQQNAVDSIVEATSQHKQSFLYLFGITGSGKTEVYLQAINKILQQGKSVIYLVPEISLTYQASEELKKRFGDIVAILHSGLTAGRRLAQWNLILQDKIRIVLGVRSAIFAPVKKLGLIIIDEEHDGSYKSSSTPRYHARQVAMMRSEEAACPLVMGSATPSVEAWHLMNTGHIKKLCLTKRLAGGGLPTIDVVSMQGERYFLSLTLLDEIKKNKAENKQTIIFLNRRGFARLYVCHSCGFQLLCKNCSIPMTWHKSSGLMKCHYCGWQSQPPQKCPDCGSLEAGFSSFGTEYIEEEMQRLLPDCTVERVDTDSISRNSKKLQEKISAFKEKKADILLGTQMVAKGLNFPDVQLVGIALADTDLQMPDFRASERTFSLLTQVAGRAGRFLQNGKVIIQTLRPSHPAICFAQQGDIEAFYEYELQIRRQLGFPPFARLLRIVVRSKNTESAQSTCAEITELLKKHVPPNADVFGPAECMLSLIAGNRRYQILLKYKTISPLQRAVKKVLQDYKTPASVYLELDVDPINLF